MAPNRAPTLRLHVDRIRCDGYGMCAELLPELVELDDWGYPILRTDLVPTELEGLARKAVDVCPVLALRLSADARRTPTRGPTPVPTPARAAAPRAGSTAVRSRP